MLGDVSPRLTQSDSVNHGGAQSEVDSDSLLGLAGQQARSDGPYIRFRRDRLAVPFSTRGGLRFSVLSVARSIWSTLGTSPRPVSVSPWTALGMLSRSILITTCRLLASFHVAIFVVLGLSPEPKMRRVYAAREVASVENMKSVSNWPKRKNPGQPMGANHSALVLNESIASPVSRASPDPAFSQLQRDMGKDRPILVYFVPEIVWGILSHSRVEPPTRFRGQGRLGADTPLRSAHHTTAGGE